MSAEFLLTFGERLARERVKLGLTIEAFASLAGASKRAVIDWEKGVSRPNATYLCVLAVAGVDVPFVISGYRIAAAELEMFRRSSAVTLEAQTKGAASGELARLNVEAMQKHAELIGSAPVGPVTLRENDLLDNYRNATLEGKKLIEHTSEVVEKATDKPKKKTR